jgi:hypothetical protein
MKKYIALLGIALCFSVPHAARATGGSFIGCPDIRLENGETCIGSGDTFFKSDFPTVKNGGSGCASYKDANDKTIYCEVAPKVGGEANE